MAKDLLFEIGAEEIPAGFMPNILGQLKQLTETKLNDAHLPFESIATYGTPRRLALIVKGLADTSAEISERHKGPSASIAYDADGNATKAAIGFARGKGLDVADLVVEDGYIYAETKTAGVPAKSVGELALRPFSLAPGDIRPYQGFNGSLYGGIPAVFLLPDPSNDIGICLVVQFQLDLCGIPLIIPSLRLIF